MASWAIPAFLLFAVYLVLMKDTNGKPPGTFDANNEEVQKCKDIAGDRIYYDAYKKGRLLCRVHCQYGEKEPYEEEEINSPEKQPCCPIGGLATGTCRNGTCDVGQFYA